MNTLTQKQKTAAGVISGIQIATGVIVTCLLFYPEFLYGQGTFALPILMSGILGCCAGFRKSASFGIYMAFCIISCVVALIYSVFAFMTLSSYTECDHIICILMYTQAILMILGGIASLAGSILSCTVCCGNQSPDPQVGMIPCMYTGQGSTNPELTRVDERQLECGDHQFENPQYPQYPQDSQYRRF